MDIITLCLCCLVASLVIFVVALILGQKRMRQVEEIMHQLAETHGASFTPGNILYNPCVTFSEGEQQLRLYAALGGRDDPSHTEVRVVLPENLGKGSTPEGGADTKLAQAVRPSLRIRPHSFKTRLTVTLGAKLFLTGDQAFDEAFDTRGAPEALLHRCLTPEVRQSLLALKVDRPAVHLGRMRTWLPERRDKTVPSAGSAWQTFFQRLLHPPLRFIFYTGGLPLDLEAWEPRLATARLLLAQITQK